MISRSSSNRIFQRARLVLACAAAFATMALGEVHVDAVAAAEGSATSLGVSRQISDSGGRRLVSKLKFDQAAAARLSGLAIEPTDAHTTLKMVGYKDVLGHGRTVLYGLGTMMPSQTGLSFELSARCKPLFGPVVALPGRAVGRSVTAAKPDPCTEWSTRITSFSGTEAKSLIVKRRAFNMQSVSVTLLGQHLFLSRFDVRRKRIQVVITTVF